MCLFCSATTSANNNMSTEEKETESVEVSEEKEVKEEKETESVEVSEEKEVKGDENESPIDNEKKDEGSECEEGDAIDSIETEKSKEAKLISTENEKEQTDQTNETTTDQTNEEPSTGRKKIGKIIERGIKGVVKWYNVRCAYGFISRDDKEQDLFVHRSGISLTKSSDFVRSLEDGELVECDMVENSKGSEAINVTGPDGGPVKGSKFARTPRPFYARQFTGRPANGTGYRGGRARFQNQGYDDYEGGPLPLQRRFPRTFDGFTQYDRANTMPSRGRFGDRRNNNNRMSSYGGGGRGGFNNNRNTGYGSGYRDNTYNNRSVGYGRGYGSGSYNNRNIGYGSGYRDNTYNNRSVGYGRGYGSGSYNNRNIGYGNRRGSAPRSYMRGRERSWVGSERRRRDRNEDEGAEDGENVVEKENVEPERRARQKQRQSRYTRHERHTTRRRKETSEIKIEDGVVQEKDDETKEVGEPKEEEESKIESNVEVVSSVEIKLEKKEESQVDIVVDTLAINGGAGDGPNQQIDIKDEKPGPADVIAEE